MTSIIYDMRHRQYLMPTTIALIFSASIPHRNTRQFTKLMHSDTPVARNTPPRPPKGQVSSQVSSRPPLSLLPLSTLVRSYLVMTLCSSPHLLDPALATLSRLVNSPAVVADPDRNPLLKYALKKTIYAHFCAGETTEEAKETILSLKNMGYSGVILGYAKECDTMAKENVTADTCTEIEIWKRGNLETVLLADQGDFVALKFTGAGKHALELLAQQVPPDRAMNLALSEICDLARARGVRLAFDAECQLVQPGIDAWTLDLQRRYNNTNRGKALVYGTYQAYLRSTPATLARHIAAAELGQFTLGVKLVRGAYLSSDPRHLIWNRKEDTDATYDGIAEALMHRRFNSVLTAPHAASCKILPAVSLILASHNRETVERVLGIRQKQDENSKLTVEVVYAQLMGMADEVSCALLHARRDQQMLEIRRAEKLEAPLVYKYLVWGTVSECMKYLLRRGEENRDALMRTKQSYLALKGELLRRFSSR